MFIVKLRLGVPGVLERPGGGTARTIPRVS